jgi:hypothetical protein
LLFGIRFLKKINGIRRRGIDNNIVPRDPCIQLPRRITVSRKIVDGEFSEVCRWFFPATYCGNLVASVKQFSDDSIPNVPCCTENQHFHTILS